jgi:nucleoside-diphosphate-sugar epimerase
MDYVNSGFIHNLVSNQKSLEVFVYFSAGEVYGADIPSPIKESSPTKVTSGLNRSSYPLAKIRGEKILLELASNHNFNPFIIRLFHTFGPGIRRNDGRSISDFFWQARLGRPPELYSDGTAQRSFLFVADMVSALFYILNSKSNDTTFNVGSEQNISIKDFASMISKECNLEAGYRLVNKNPGHEASPIKNITPTLDKLKNLGWEESFSLKQGINITLSWIESQLLKEYDWSNH